MAKNVAVSEEILAEMREEARAEGKTPDQLFEEAAKGLLKQRQLRSFVSQNRREALARGLTETDVPRLIEESRKERRGR